MFLYCEDKHVALYSEDSNYIERAYRVIDKTTIVSEVPKGTNVYSAIGTFIQCVLGGK